jgi:hypothetical protein
MRTRGVARVASALVSVMGIPCGKLLAAGTAGSAAGGTRGSRTYAVRFEKINPRNPRHCRRPPFNFFLLKTFFSSSPRQRLVALLAVRAKG